MDASDHAGHDSESLMEMHSAEAVLAIASSDSNSTPADVPLRALLVLARLLSFPPEHRPEALFELVALMAAVVNTVRPSKRSDDSGRVRRSPNRDFAVTAQDPSTSRQLSKSVETRSGSSVPIAKSPPSRGKSRLSLS